MGGRSNKKSVDTSRQTQSTMDGLAKGRVSNGTMLDILKELQNSQMGGVLPIFDMLMSNANSRFDNHPMMPFFGGQQAPPPQQPLFDTWQAQQPQQPKPQQPQTGGPTPQQRKHQTPYGIDPAPYAHLPPNLRGLMKAQELRNPGMPLHTDSPLLGDLSGVRR